LVLSRGDPGSTSREWETMVVGKKLEKPTSVPKEGDVAPENGRYPRRLDEKRENIGAQKYEGLSKRAATRGFARCRTFGNKQGGNFIVESSEIRIGALEGRRFPVHCRGPTFRNYGLAAGPLKICVASEPWDPRGGRAERRTQYCLNLRGFTGPENPMSQI